MDQILSSLSPSQREAVEYTGGPELVIAGAGSGKTRVLTYKIAYLLGLDVKPWSILALTFTNKAAREMKERVGQLVGADTARRLNMGTFHSVFLRILRAEAEAIGLTSSFTIYDDSDSRALVTAIVKEMQLDDKMYKPAAVLSRIGMAKNNLITPELYLNDVSLTERDARSGMPKTGEIYRAYAQRCRMAGAVDFDDMLLFTYMLFANHKDICRKYAERFDYVLVDEYQDTNYAQQCIVTLLTREKGNICVVGDDAQSIYAFRGANIDNILNFQNIYQGARMFKLEQNYRSTQNIVEAANCLISHNRQQIRKHVFSENMSGDRVKLNITYSDREEAALVAQELKAIHRGEGVAYSDFAILYRTNAQSRLFEEELRRSDVPYRIYGGMSFYQRKEIKDIIAYFRLVANTDDEEALKRVINYPKRGIGGTTVDRLIAAARQSGVGLWTVTGEPSRYGATLSAATERRVIGFHAMMQTFVDARQTQDVYELGRRIIQDSGIAKDVFESQADDAADRKSNVEEFVSGLRGFVDMKRQEGYADEFYVTDFLQEVALLTDADRDAADQAEAADCVSLMTIHASKGLEFNTVFIVGVEENLFPSQRACEFPRELEEERRLLYVAITRAERHCFLSCAKSRYQYGSLSFNEPSRFLRDIDSKWLDVSGGKLPGRASRGYADSQAGHDNPFAAPMGHGNPFGAPSAGAANHRTQLPRHNIPDPPRLRRIASRPAANSAAAAKTTAPQVPTLAVGTRIEHQRFGPGTVVSVEGSGENEKATVNFDNAGKKTLLLKFARFTVK